MITFVIKEKKKKLASGVKNETITHLAVKASCICVHAAGSHHCCTLGKGNIGILNLPANDNKSIRINIHN